jgi:putative glutamine amidotransferase
MALIRAFVQAGKPVFGICRGLQLLNVCFGGTLLQDIAHPAPEALDHRQLGRYEDHFHSVEFVPGTHLASLYPARRRPPPTASTTRASRTWRRASWWKRAAPKTA